MIKIFKYLCFIGTLIFMLACSTVQKEEIEFDMFEPMQKGYDIMKFISSFSSKNLEVSDYEMLDKKLEKLGFMKEVEDEITVGNEKFEISGDYLLYRSSDEKTLIYLESGKNIFNRWNSLKSLIGRYTGINVGVNGSKGTFYLKMEPQSKASLNATFRSHRYIVNIRSELSFNYNDSLGLSKQEEEEVIKTNNRVSEILQNLSEVLSTKKDMVYRSLDGRVLSSEERLFGFIEFWTEVKYNFAFFNQVPKLDWNEVLLEYTPKVKENQTNMEYYTLMQEICAKLKDGHTNINLPSELNKKIVNVPIELQSIDNEIYITNVGKSLDSIILLGSKLRAVDGIPVEEYILNKKYPLISSSTEHIKRKMAVSTLLEGETGQKVELEIETISGKVEGIVLERTKENTEWTIPNEKWELFEYGRFGEISYVSLNSFGTPKIYDEFERYIDSIGTSKSLIIDLRKNGGGNSGNGYEILKYLAPKPFLTSKWKTREHKASHKAWGSFIDSQNPNLGSWDREVLQTFNGDFWFESSADTIVPYLNKIVDLPMAILIGNNTASAAEDFLVAAESISLGSTIGDYTYGSTGQPLLMALPGGGSARICTKRDTYPDGREFVGYGIKPDFLIKESIDDILSENDPVLKFAIEYLSTKE